ncbi:winged helix-turn-helix transcriptional regulator [Streptomyces sp. NBC_01497]|uniref:winged helix-turn-helix transcriptional regulator n=1 Tax=Streptomyces sp. NBC_01497 TaxID=2903885 RepID=UPI002E313F88|nr:helix-turn-helix domain-containing protein [Streptomyces sp. NBC_01497]
MGNVPNDPCAIARSLGVLGERWTFLILREAAMNGASRFSEFRKALGVASDVLNDRLGTMVNHGVFEKVPYQDPGERARSSYSLTPAGHELLLILAALQQWGDKNLPWAEGPSLLRRVRGTDQAVRVGFVDDHGREVGPDDFTLVRTASYPTAD